MSFITCTLMNCRIGDEVGWGRWAEEGNGGDPYALPSWIRAVMIAYGWEGFAVIVKSGMDGFDANEVFLGDGRSTALLPSVGKSSTNVAGVLPLIELSFWGLGRALVSMPYCDGGSGDFRSVAVESAALREMLLLAERRGALVVDIRRQVPLDSLAECFGSDHKRKMLGARVAGYPDWSVTLEGAARKVRMVRELPEDLDLLRRSFRAKLRSQIRKPIKEGLFVRVGGLELMRDFYRVFAENMRDIGSPVHSKRFLESVVANNCGTARIFVVYLGHEALGGSVTLGFNGVLSNPWASSLRRFSRLSPNMLLYWSMLKYACENGYRTFDFGRSTVGEGTYRFKEQWGARPEPLYWYRFARADGKGPALHGDSGWMSRAVEIWKRLPVPVTEVLGPRIRRHISL